MTPTGKTSQSSRLFGAISWGVTALVVLAMLGVTLWRILPSPVAAAPQPTPTEETGTTTQPVVAAVVNDTEPAITRQVSLKTTIPAERPRYNVQDYTVIRGDSIFGIAKQFNIKPETLLWANYDTLKDSPDSLRVGQELNIPPVDGVYYEWQEGDTLDSIAEQYSATVEDILSWPGNDIDLTNPDVKPGTYVMIPNGKRQFVQWLIPTIARGKSGTTSVGTGACSGGAFGSGGFIWPAANHYLSGNDFWSGHLAIDIAAGEGAPVYAADSGVVTMAGWNSNGYGNVIMIDHGNGYVTLYAHLSQFNVSTCQSVYQGATIGWSGNTGNSFGAHLHFEVRQNGGFISPWYVLP